MNKIKEQPEQVATNLIIYNILEFSSGKLLIKLYMTNLVSNISILLLSTKILSNQLN